jgi:hypothetical protein
MEAVKYYYAKKDSDDPVGPVSLERLRELATDGVVTANTPVIREGADEWARYRDFHTGERTREVAEVVMDRAARMAARLQTEESRSFSLGFLIGLVRFLTLPWDIVARSTRVISEWGAARFIAIPADRLASATLGQIATPVFILLWTVLWVGDVVCMLIVGRPSFSLTIMSWVSGFILMGVELGGPAGFSQRIVASAVQSAVMEALTVHDFGDRLAWAIKIGCVGYFFTIGWAVMGEFFSGLAALIGLRAKTDVGPNRA